MRKPKKKYDVFIHERRYGCYGNVDQRHHTGTTWAVSPEAAINNVRFRNGDKYTFREIGDRLDEGSVSYEYEAEEA